MAFNSNKLPFMKSIPKILCNDFMSWHLLGWMNGLRYNESKKFDHELIHQWQKFHGFSEDDFAIETAKTKYYRSISDLRNFHEMIQVIGKIDKENANSDIQLSIGNIAETISDKIDKFEALKKDIIDSHSTKEASKTESYWKKRCQKAEEYIAVSNNEDILHDQKQAKKEWIKIKMNPI